MNPLPHHPGTQVLPDEKLFAEVFSDQVATSRPARTWAQRAALASTWTGAGLFAMTLAVPTLGGTWAMLLLTTGLVAGGGLVYFRLTYAGTEPGIKHDGIAFHSATRRGATGWVAGVLMTAFYCTLYWWDDAWGASPLSGGILLVDPLAEFLSGSPADKWFLYGAVYTFAVLVMGVRMVWRYRHSRYHLWRTASVS
ncbi:MAG: hypothetical protein VX000_05060, partial [Myxococcota bacterium]|nr:hypothetical protein [Myxococcota bacterium]